MRDGTITVGHPQWRKHPFALPRPHYLRLLGAARLVALVVWVSNIAFVHESFGAGSTTLLNWGLETAAEIEQTLGLPGSPLYSETASATGALSGGFNGKAYIWPESTQFRVMNTLTQIAPGTYATDLRAFSDSLRSAYWSNGYRSGAGGGDRFYDDNAHMAVALMEAYRITRDPVYLTRAKETFSFVKQGEDSAGGGGIYFKQGDLTTKDAISTLQGARSAAMLYLTTGDSSYLADATRLLTWAETHIQRSDGLYYQRLVISSGQTNGVELVNAAGIGISLNLELYDATGASKYLTEAQRIATRSLSRFFDSSTGRINDEGYWAFELVDGLDNLYLHDRNPLWLSKVDGALAWLHANKRDAEGHYGVYWGRNGAQVGTLSSWNLNDQAAVARAYLYTSTIPEPTVVGWFLSAALILGVTRRGQHARWHL